MKYYNIGNKEFIDQDGYDLMQQYSEAFKGVVIAKIFKKDATAQGLYFTTAYNIKARIEWYLFQQFADSIKNETKATVVWHDRYSGDAIVTVAGHEVFMWYKAKDESQLKSGTEIEGKIYVSTKHVQFELKAA